MAERETDSRAAAGRSAGPRRELAVHAHDMREHLPGLEPDRQINDWGRSERVEGAVDGTLWHFLYHYWFRVAVEGIEHVPNDGPALLVANHAGAVLPSAAMVAKAVRQRHPRARPVHFVTDPKLNDLPAVGMLVTKVGGVPNHPANLHRLLYDEEQLVLAFPEATKHGKSSKDRYRLRPFGEDESIETAVRARAPIVPVAIVGAEEAFPVIAHLPGISLTPPFPLPARFRVRFLEPVAPTGAPDGLARDLSAVVQENLLAMLSERRSVWLG